MLALGWRYSGSLSFQELILRVCFHVMTLFSRTKLVGGSSPPPLDAFYQVVVPEVQCSEKWVSAQVGFLHLILEAASILLKEN